MKTLKQYIKHYSHHSKHVKFGSLGLKLYQYYCSIYLYFWSFALDSYRLAIRDAVIVAYLLILTTYSCMNVGVRRRLYTFCTVFRCAVFFLFWLLFVICLVSDTSAVGLPVNF